MTKKEREEMTIAKAKKRALSTAMMRELRAEYSEAPEEVRDDMNLHRFKQSMDDKHRTAYEEDNFKRVMLTKDEKVSPLATQITVSLYHMCVRSTNAVLWDNYWEMDAAI